MNCPECGAAVTGKDFAIKGKGETFVASFVCPGCKKKRRKEFPSTDFGNEAAIQLAVLHPEVAEVNDRKKGKS